MQNNYDAIIIGTGIGGAGIGALLAHKGWKILIVDKNDIIGGRCTSYDYNGYKLDLGVHLFGVGDKGSLGEICRMIETPDAIEWVTVSKSTMQVGDVVSKYSQKTMMAALPDEEKMNLNKLFHKVATLSDEEINDLWYVTLYDWVSQFSKNNLVHTFIESISTQYFCIPSKETSAAEFINCFKSVLNAKSSAYPKGGCIAIPQAYMNAIEKHGGDIKLGAEVNKILIENGEAVGVQVGEDKYYSPVIISNADIKTTVMELAGKENFPEEYIKQIEGLTYSYGAVMIKVALKEKISDDQLRMYMPNDVCPIIYVSEDLKNGIIPDLVGGMIVSPTNFDSKLGPEGEQLICFGTGCPPDQEKELWEKTLIDSFMKAYPQAEGKVLWYKIDTPQLVEEYALEDGNIIGVGQTVSQVKDLRPSVKSPLKGLYFASSEAGGHGIGTELAANSAKELFEVLSCK